MMNAGNEEKSFNCAMPCSEERLGQIKDLLTKTMLETTNDMILVMDSKEQLVFYNKVISNALPASRQSSSISLTDLFNPKQLEVIRSKVFALSQADTDVLHENIEIFLDKGSKRFYYRLTIVSSDASDQEKLILLFGDEITQEKQDQQSYAELNHDYEIAAKSKENFLSTLGHEVRTPLSAIEGFCSILLKKSEEPSAPSYLYSYAKHINDAGIHLSRLFERMLALSIFNRTNQIVHATETDLDILAHEVVNTLVDRHHVARADIVVTIDNPAKTIMTDANKIRQIIEELLENAVKFSSPNAKRYLALKVVDDILTIEVKDEGVGISTSDEKIIYGVFEQVDSSYARQYEGCGLGLALARQLTLVLGGKITLDSRFGSGSIFRVSIPITQVLRDTSMMGDLDVASSHELPSNTEEATMRPIVLVVEDNLANQYLMKETMRDFEEVDVRIASHGHAAIDLCAQMVPSLIIMDLHMPGLDGFETTEKIKHDPRLKDVPVVALTGDPSDATKAQADRVGMADFLVKPIRFDKVVALLEKWVRKQSSK